MNTCRDIYNKSLSLFKTKGRNKYTTNAPQTLEKHNKVRCAAVGNKLVNLSITGQKKKSRKPEKFTKLPN